MFSLIDIWGSIIIALFLVYRRICPPAPTSQIPVPTLSSNRGLKRPIPLPQETLDHIFSFFLTSLVDDLRFGTVRDYRVQKKCLMQEILAVAQCSKQFHEIMFGSLGRMWASCGLGLCSRKRCPSATASPARTVWIITAEQGCLPLDIDLSVHIILEIASINYHDGIQWSKKQQEFRRFRCVRAYPRSLRQLEILRSHTPEEEVIRLVSDCCPGLTELRLVRCTIFNDPKCWYWRTHTANQDHDYMRSYDPAAVVDYANNMALLLRRLPQLEAVHIGHYLISINAVLTHRTDPAHKRCHRITDMTDHIDGALVVNSLQFNANADEGPPINTNSMRLADKGLWADPCRQCDREFKEPIEAAERWAAGIMAAHFKSLKHVSFANFLSGGRVAPSSWLVGRQQRGPDLYVRTEDPSRPRSRRMQPMVRVGDRWEPSQVAQ
ncbi:F-box-like domain protein [Rhizoctonia solani 123E]|uniref:F-box-like domain protein n=1 Tax=Rhizoctonia solani 123E TaxID=1423351 RepID=A0A074RY86_9AGAM|nr:F-box-like domain protein [Rhizoctonia solani 123E]